MLGPARDDNLGPVVVQAVIAGHLHGDGVFELVDTPHRSVLRESGRDSPDSGRLDVFRGVEIGLTGTETDDVPPLRPECVGLHGNGQCGRGFDTLDSLR